MENSTQISAFDAETVTRNLDRAEAVSRRIAELAIEAGIEILDPLHISVGDLMMDCAQRGINPSTLFQRAADDVAIAESKAV